jgi:hypothetical protein
MLRQLVGQPVMAAAEIPVGDLRVQAILQTWLRLRRFVGRAILPAAGFPAGWIRSKANPQPS